MTRFAKLRRKGVSFQLARSCCKSGILIAAENLEAGSSRTERSGSSRSLTALLASQLWQSSRCVASGSQFTTPDGWTLRAPEFEP